MQSFILSENTKPNIGDTAYGKDIGIKDLRGRYIWVACDNCGHERWVGIRHAKPPRHLCIKCIGKLGLNVQGGEKHPRWNGGTTINRGYRYIKITPDDPFYCMAREDGYVKYSRYLMAKHLGRPLTRKENVHHKDENKLNDIIENLQLFTNVNEHQRFHGIKRGGLIGVICNSREGTASV